MDGRTGAVSAVDFTTAVAGLLDHIDHDDVALLPDRKQLDLMADLLRVL